MSKSKRSTVLQFLLLLALIHGLSRSPGIASADQLAIYSYAGPAFRYSDCIGQGAPSSACVGGSIGASIFLVLPDNYIGYTNGLYLQYWSMSGPGVGTLVSDFAGGNFDIEASGISDWSMAAGNAFNEGSLSTASGNGNYDQAAKYNSGVLSTFGIVIRPPKGSWTGGKSLGAPCHHPGAISCGEPVDLGSGNMFETVSDYTTVGQNPLSFTRYYNSFTVPSTYATTLGPNWRSSYDRYLHFIAPNAVAAERQDGQVIGFVSAGGFTTDTDLDYSLAYSSGNYLLTDPDDTVETYTSSGGFGRLSSIKLRNGYTQTLSYNSSGQLSSVIDSYSRSLGFSYSSAGLITSVTTPDTLTLSYGYTLFASAGTNILTSISYNTSPITSQTYQYQNTNYPYALTGIIDENGNTFAAWQYDSSGRAVLSQNALGANYTQFSYDDSTGNRTVTGSLGIQETYKFTGLQGVPKVTEIDRASNGTVAAAVRKFSYDSNGYMNSQTDWNGNQTAYTNNSHGDPTTIVFASGSAVTHTTTIVYDSTWSRLPKTITEPDRITTLNYDSSGNVLTRVIKDQASQSVPYFTSGTTRTWTYTWSGTGQLLTAQLPRTDVTAKTTLTYSSGALTSITDALSHVTTVNTFTSGGLPLTVTDPNSILTTYTYSPRNWLTSSVLTLSSSAGTLTTTLAYDSAGNLTRRTLPDASYLAYGYDAAHRLTSITNSLGESQVLTLNSAGGITQALWKDASAVTTRQHTATFDALGRTLTDVGGMGQTTTYGYDSNGNVLSITDPLSQVSTLQFDSLNRVSSFKDPATNLTAYTYNSHDAVLSVTDPRSNVTNYTYDGFGERIQEVSPDRGTIVLKFDSDGNIVQQTDANGYVTNMTYDALDRILSRTYPADSSLNVAFTYDQAGHGQGIGHLTSGTDSTGTFSFKYEERGLTTLDSRSVAGGVYNNNFSYDSAGRYATITYASSGYLVTYTRDSAGQITGITDKIPGGSLYTIVSSVTHMPFGPVKSLTWGNGVTGAQTFDLDYRMIGIKDVGTGNVMYTSYGYNANDNLTSILDNVTPANNQTLAYNSSNWLKFASGSYGTNINLTYDSAGNRLSYGATGYVISSTSNRFTSAAGSAISYTSSGNITAIGSSPTFTYNKANQMASTTVSGALSSYSYDAFGQRLKAIGSSGTIVKVVTVDQNNHVLTVDASTSGTSSRYDYIWLDDMPVGGAYIGTAYFIHPDHLNTPLRATNASKVVDWTGTYSPFGEGTFTGSLPMDLRYPGMYNGATVMYRNGFRTYYPSLGKYVEADPIGLAGGINPYVYVNNNPYKYTDRYGELSPQQLAGAIGLGIVFINGVEEFWSSLHPPGVQVEPTGHIQAKPTNVCTATQPNGVQTFSTIPASFYNPTLIPSSEPPEQPEEMDELPDVEIPSPSGK